jgi:hypothetical protein
MLCTGDFDTLGKRLCCIQVRCCGLDNAATAMPGGVLDSLVREASAVRVMLVLTRLWYSHVWALGAAAVLWFASSCMPTRCRCSATARSAIPRRR